MFKLFSKKRTYNRTWQDLELERLLFLASATQATRHQGLLQNKPTTSELQDQSPDPDATMVGTTKEYALE
jgi:hypothetical protein